MKLQNFIVTCVFNFFCLLAIASGTTFAQESASATSAVSISHGPYLCNMNETGVTIVWTTSEPAKSWIEVSKNNFTTDESVSFYEKAHGAILATNTLHKVNITDLTPNTQFSYKVVSQKLMQWNGGYDVALGEKTVSQSYNFRTFDTNKSSTKFVVLNDIHENNELLRNLLASINFLQCDAGITSCEFIIYNGDMAHTLESEDHLFGAFQDTAVDVFGKVTPIFYARGNHETRGKLASKMIDYFPMKDGKFYYMFRQGPIACLVLDAGEDKPDDNEAYFSLADYDDYRTEEAAWLSEAVKSKEFKDARFRVVIMHIPPTDKQDDGDTNHGAIDVYRKFVPLLNEANIDCMLCGHTHRTAKVDPIEGKIEFPILTNSNKTCFVVEADNSTLQIFNCDQEGNRSEFFSK